jgi:glyoxylase-like metal-dependent hydrolase (beta-lactamase superfamily II)
MFIVTSQGVIATDPVAYGKPEASVQYVAEIRKITNQPIKYLIYSHHHFDHIAGGKPFKDAGATIIAHRRAAERLKVLQDPATPLPDEIVGDEGRVIRLGGKILELNYVGLNHSDSTLVFRLPQDRLLFLVDLIPVGTFPGLGMIDFHPLEAMESYKKILAMDWTRMIPGHPGQPGDRLGTKKDVEDHIAMQQHFSDVVKAQARAGKCWNPAEAEVQFEKYKDLPGYATGRPITVRRYCGLWGRGT